MGVLDSRERLVDIRKRLVEYTGRYDLVVDTTTYADNGANWYIQQGQRWLDRTSTLYQSEARWYHSVAVGDWYALVPQCRSIEQAWMSNDPSNPLVLGSTVVGWPDDDWFISTTDGNKWKMRKYSLEDLRWKFRGDPALMDKGVPQSYAVPSIRTVPESDFYTVIDEWGATSYKKHEMLYGNVGIIWMPPASSVLKLEVQGLFYQSKLVFDYDENVWTAEHPELLVLAACRAIELSMRNHAGVDDYRSPVSEALQTLEFDLVDAEASEIRGMSG